MIIQKALKCTVSHAEFITRCRVIHVKWIKVSLYQPIKTINVFTIHLAIFEAGFQSEYEKNISSVYGTGYYWNSCRLTSNGIHRTFDSLHVKQ